MPFIYTNLFLEAIRVSLCQKTTDDLTALLQTHSFDWNEIRHQSFFHGIRPLLYDALKQVDPELVDPVVFDELKKLSMQQSLFNLFAAKEAMSVLAFLGQHGIAAIPFKGIVYVHELYGNKALREGTDLDIFVRRIDAHRAMKLLVDEAGHQFTVPDEFRHKYSTDELIEVLLATRGYHEVGLEKPGTQVHIDFHWEVYEDFYQYNVPEAMLFNSLTEQPFFSTKLSLPNPEALFWMMLIHHGGREVWTRLKYFADLLTFYQRFGSKLDWVRIIQQAGQYRLLKPLITGFYVLEKQFGILVPAPFQPYFADPVVQRNYARIVRYWDIAQSRNATFATKRRSYGLFFGLQDTGFSYVRHMRFSFLKRSQPNPLEIDERVVVFAPEHTVLNFFGKLSSALLLYIGVKKRR